MNNLSYFQAMGSILPLIFYSDGCGIKYPTKVDMPLNKEAKPNQTKKKNEHHRNMASKNNVTIWWRSG